MSSRTRIYSVFLKSMKSFLWSIWIPNFARLNRLLVAEWANDCQDLLELQTYVFKTSFTTKKKMFKFWSQKTLSSSVFDEHLNLCVSKFSTSKKRCFSRGMKMALFLISRFFVKNKQICIPQRWHLLSSDKLFQYTCNHKAIRLCAQNTESQLRCDLKEVSLSCQWGLTIEIHCNLLKWQGSSSLNSKAMITLIVFIDVQHRV